MVVEEINDHVVCTITTCFIPSRDIRNNIVLVNSLIDGNTDGVIMMLDWAKAYDSVDLSTLRRYCFTWDAVALVCKD